MTVPLTLPFSCAPPPVFSRRRLRFLLSADRTLGQVLEHVASTLPDLSDLDDLHHLHANDKESESPELLETTLAGGIKLSFGTSSSGSFTTVIRFNNILGHAQHETVRIQDHWNALIAFF